MMTRNDLGRVAVGAGMGLAMLAAGSAGADDKTAVTRTVDAIDECRRISTDSERLACFDRAAAALVAARGKGELIVLDREKVVERRRQRFGLAMDSDPGINAAEVTELTLSVRTARPAKSPGRWDLELANGSVWQTIDPVRFAPKVGDEITLKIATMGGFRARIDGRSVLIKRVR